ncbi:MAG TPA: WG repeat-containing protein, partial [Bacteroidia bacterium]|nr:WG repeat-containing protein [Bacteroidia bacterium]
LVRPSYTLIQPMRENVAIAFNSERKSLINRHGELLVPQGLHDILVRGKSVKVLRRDSSALYLRLDDNGRIVSQEEYDEFRVIKIGGREGSIAGNPAMTFAQLAAMPLFPIDSTDWFVLDNKWGLRNSFNGKVIIDPKYDFVIQGPRNIVKVGIRDTIPVMMIDDRQGYSGFRFGLVNDTSGKIILQPKYPQIYVEDFGWHGFYGFVRATLPDGKMALVSTDGSEQHMTYTWIDRPHEGYARFCIAGKWSIQTPGEMTHIVSSFSGEQNLLGELTFGRIYNAGNDFLQRPVYITGAKWGYLDSAGHIAVQPEYEAATRPAKATGLVRKDKKWGLIGMDAVVRIPCAYDGMAYLRVDTVVLVQAYMRNLRYGYLNQNGKIVISPTLKNSKPLGNGFLGFSRTGKWGIMNTNGLEICPETYHEILPFSEGFAAVRLGNRWGFIDTAGTEVIPAKYEKAGAFRNGMARVLLRQRWGFIDKENNLLVEAKFLQAGDFRGMSAPVKTIQGWGLVNRSGHFLLKAVWKAIVPLDSAGPAIFIIRNETASGLARSDGKIILSPIYNAYLWLGEGRIGYRSGLYWGMLDTTGRAVTQNIFDRIKPFGENYAAVSYEGKWGFINSNGKFVIRPSYKTAGIFNMNRAYVITQENRSCLIDTTGKIVMQFARGMGIAGYTEGKFLVHTYDRRNEINLMAYYNRHGSRIGRLEFKKATVFTDGAARVSPNGRTWGLISFTGFYLIKPRFAILDPFKNGLARFQLQTTQGLFRLDGSVMLPVAYDWISYNTDFRLIQIEHGNGLGYLYLNGAVCWPVAE